METYLRGWQRGALDVAPEEEGADYLRGWNDGRRAYREAAYLEQERTEMALCRTMLKETGVTPVSAKKVFDAIQRGEMKR